MRILFVARSLGRGGAERQLSQLACALKQAGEEVRVAVFFGGGAFEEHLVAAGVPLIDLRKRGSWDVIGLFRRLLSVIAAFRPQLIYSFMLGPNLLAVAIKPFVGTSKVVWGIRSSTLDWRVYGRAALYASHLERLLARYPDLVICNSDAGRHAVLDLGFPSARTIVIPNGIDTDLFRPDHQAGRRMREGWGLREGDVLIGIVGRLDPHKGYPLFFDAARKVLQEIPQAIFACVGDGPEAYKREVKRCAASKVGDAHIIWAGAQDDMVGVYNGLDVLVLCSRVEGFPNVLAEAMACGTPVVTTAAGDAAAIVGDDSWIVRSRNGDDLADAIIRCARGQRAGIADRNRERILHNYSLETAVRRFRQAVTCDRSW